MADDELAPAIATALKGVKEGEITDVVKVPTGFYIVKVLGASKEVKQAKVKEPPKPVGDASVREKVRARLYNEELGHKVDEWVKELQSRAYIQVLL